MSELLLSKHTKQQLSLMVKSPPHAILITGPSGSGKRTVARYLASKLLNVSQDKLIDYPYFILVERPAGKQEISIDAVREVIKKLNLKPVIGSKKPVNRVVLIEDAHYSSAEAQNALLKAIEEPPAGTVFVLTAISDTSVLPTIASRSQSLKIGSVSLAVATKFFGDQYDKGVIESAWQLSGGSAGLLSAILRDASDHPLRQSVEVAKKIIGLKSYERILFFDELSSKKVEFVQTLDALGRILAALHRSAIANNSKNATKILKARQQVQMALTNLENNTSPRLIALNLAISLPV